MNIKNLATAGDSLPDDSTGTANSPASGTRQTTGVNQALGDYVQPIRDFENFRNEITAEIVAMSRHVMGGRSGNAIGDSASAVLGGLDRGEALALEALIEAHHELKALVAPATPNALLAKSDRIKSNGLIRFLGPNPIVRQLTMANMFFLLMFFGVSLSPLINQTTLQLSIYDQAGTALLIKLVFLVAAAGLGASFGALFDVWDDLRTDRFDPKAESVHWMKVGLGIVAGLALTEIFQTTAPTGDAGNPAGPALLALVGGFSAGLLHIALSRLVNAVKSIFMPPNES